MLGTRNQFNVAPMKTSKGTSVCGNHSVSFSVTQIQQSKNINTNAMNTLRKGQKYIRCITSCIAFDQFYKKSK